MELEEIEKKISKLEKTIDATPPNSITIEQTKEWLKYKLMRNKIKPYNLKERAKLKTIKNTLGFVEDLEELKIKSKTKYEKVREKARRLLKKKGIITPEEKE